MLRIKENATRILAVLFCFVMPAAAQPLTIGEAIDLARQHSERLQQAEFEIDKSAASVREARGNLLPQVSAGTQYTGNIQRPVIFLPPDSPFGNVLRLGANHSLNVNLQASMPLYNARARRALTVAQAAETMNRRLLQATTREVETEAQRAYLNALLARELRDALRLSFDRRSRNLELVRAMEEHGVVPEYDLIRTDVQVRNLEPELVRAVNSYEGALNYLKLLTGIPMDRRIDIAGTLDDYYHADIKELELRELSSDFSGNPSVMQIEGQLSIAEKQVDLERAAYRPSLSLMANRSYQSQGDHLRLWAYDWIKTASLGVTLEIPVFNFHRSDRVRQAEISVRQARSQLDFTERSLEVEYRTTLDRLAQTRQAIDSQRKNMSQAERVYGIARASYEHGAHTLLDVNDAELALTDARLNYIQVLHDYLTTLLDMEDVLGRELTGFRSKEIR
ncbi:MAG TPA: TolC family protein [Acidobacteriota bacterium]|nr:TolC family protein [Acidobacteriota bacterium]